LLLRLGRNAAHTLQLDKHHKAVTSDHHDIGKPAPNATLLLQKAIQERARSIFEARPKHGRWIKIPRQQPDELHMLGPFLTTVPASLALRFIFGHAPPLADPSCDGATGVGGAIPATSMSCLHANILVCNGASLSGANAIPASNRTASDIYRFANDRASVMPSDGLSDDGDGVVGLRSVSSMFLAIETSKNIGR